MNIYSIKEQIFYLFFKNSRVILIRIRRNSVYLLKNLALFA